MTPLAERLIQLIETDGPIPVSTFMQLALHDPVSGYYATRPGLGQDFTTAPEISQIFGELIGLWIVHEWRALGQPEDFILVEVGPGRGVLMQDALRIASVAGGAPFRQAAKLTLIEPSPALREVQSARLDGWSPDFAEALADVPSGPMLLIANEYLDCLPVRQFRHDGQSWRECVVGLDPSRKLAFGLSADASKPSVTDPQAGQVVEIQTGLDLIVADLALRPRPFRALFIDYGPSDRTPGDTLRAYRGGQQVPPLERPGESDLTADVDFARFARLAHKAGLEVAGPLAQGLLLLGLGAQARLDQLLRARPEHAQTLFSSAARLIDPAQMGEKFKAICLSSPGLPQPAGF